MLHVKNTVTVYGSLFYVSIVITDEFVHIESPLFLFLQSIIDR